MLAALLERDSTFDGVFYACVTTTGVFCNPSCAAPRPGPRSVRLFPSIRECLAAGFRPCPRCRPLEPAGAAPDWLRPLMKVVELHPTRRLADRELRERQLDPVRVRRWFQREHGMTFHAYHRARRLGLALGHLGSAPNGTASVGASGSKSRSRGAFEHWFSNPAGRAPAARVVLVERLLTPLGAMVAGATDEGLALLEFADRPMLETQVRRLRKHLDCRFVSGRQERKARGARALIAQARRELEQYFEGERNVFQVPLALPGTPFQRAAWEALLRVPYGETRSYQAQAHALGRPGAHRAVGRANGDNRIAVIVPCHRLVQRDGSLGGYGGGLWRKRRLLELEQRNRGI